MAKRTIRISELTCSTYSKKDNSPRGCITVSSCDINIGDYVVIDNYFTLVVADGKEQSEWGWAIKDVNKIPISDWQKSTLQKMNLARWPIGNTGRMEN